MTMGSMKGTAKVNTSVLTPGDVLREAKLTHMRYGYVPGREPHHTFTLAGDADQKTLANEQWKRLPDFLNGSKANVICVADTSGSMDQADVLADAIGLMLYFAQRNKGTFHNLGITFSEIARPVSFLDDVSLEKNLERIPSIVENTNLKSVFELLLSIAKENNAPQEDMPTEVVVISDMEIDPYGDLGNGGVYRRAGMGRNNFLQAMREKFEDAGYQLPHIVLWNMDARNKVFLGNSNEAQYVSGRASAVFGQLLKSLGKSATELIHDTLYSERYECVVI